MNLTITQLLIIVNICIFAQIDIISIFLSKYALFSPSLINNYHQLPRLIVPHFTHISPIHLFINMVNFARIGNVMESLLKNYYLPIILISAILSSTIHILLSLLGIYLYNMPNIYYGYSLGFSSVIFALKYIYFKRLNTVVNIFGFDMNSQNAIWCELFIAQLMVPNASFIGHLCGILAGVILNEVI